MSERRTLTVDDLLRRLLVLAEAFIDDYYARHQDTAWEQLRSAIENAEQRHG